MQHKLHKKMQKAELLWTQAVFVWNVLNRFFWFAFARTLEAIERYTGWGRAEVKEPEKVANLADLIRGGACSFDSDPDEPCKAPDSPAHIKAE